MKSNCRNCHFLSKEYRDNTGQTFVFSLTKDEREKVIVKPDEVVSLHYSLSCHMGVWNEGVSGTSKDRDSIINITKRDYGCFFIRITLQCYLMQLVNYKSERAKTANLKNLIFTRV